MSRLPSTDRAITDDAQLPAVAAMLVVYFSHVVTRRAVVDTSVEHIVYEIVTVALMLGIAYRSNLGWLSMPAAPNSFRSAVPLARHAGVMWVVVVTATLVVATEIGRASGRLVSALGVSTTSTCDDPGNSSCCSYNDPACSGDGALVDVLEVFTASIGEELAYRYAVLVIVSRVAGVRVAVAVQAIVFGLSHTGFDGGYGADVVAGLIAVGAVSAIAVLVTRSIWPAIVAHALHSMGVAAIDHDLTAVSWVVTAMYVLSTVIGALVISRIAVSFVFRRR